jgi:hypothetical protein
LEFHKASLSKYCAVVIDRAYSFATPKSSVLPGIRATSRQIRHIYGARLQHIKPVSLPGHAPEDEGIFVRVEFSCEMIAGPGRRQGSRHRQTALVIEG